MVRTQVFAFAFSLAAILVSLFAVGAGHGTNLPAYFLLPWTMCLAMARFDNIVLLLTALAQFPLYAALICHKRLLAIPLAAAHLVAALTHVARDGVSM